MNHTGHAGRHTKAKIDNAAGAKNRLSNFDITDDGEEPDPLNQRFGNQRFCAQCGERLPENAKFCPACGEKIVWNKEEAP